MTLLNKILKNELFRSSSFLAFSTALSALSRFLLITILARYLSAESYGVWVSITSVAAIMMFGDFGITNALRNKLSELLANDRTSDDLQREYFYTSFYFFLVVSIVLSIMFFYFSSYFQIEKLYNTNDQLLKQKGVDIFIFIQIIFILTLPFGLAPGLFFSYNESKIYAIFNILNSSTSIFVTITLTLLKFDILILAKAYFSCSFSFSIAMCVFFLYKRKWNKFSINLKLAPQRVYELLKTGIFFLGIQLSTSFLNNIPTIFIGAVDDLKTAASFNIAQKLYTMVITIYQSVFNPIWAKLSSLAAFNKWSEFRKIHKQTILISLGIVSTTTIIFTIFSDIIFKIVAGDNIYANHSIVFAIGLSMFFFILFDSTSLVQNSLGKIKFKTFLTVLTALSTNSIFNFLFPLFGIISVPYTLSCIWALMSFVLYKQGLKLISQKAGHSNI